MGGSGLGRAFETPDLPADLRGAIDRHRRAVEQGDRGGVAAQASPEARDGARAEYAKIERPLEYSEIVGVARVGAHRMVKAAFCGAGGLAVVQQQWRPGPDGWQLHGA